MLPWRTGMKRRGLASHGRVVCLQEEAKAKFNESMEVAINLGVDPRRGDQQVRGAVVLPHGTGTDTRVAVFAEDEAAEAARAAGERRSSSLVHIGTTAVSVHKLHIVAGTCAAQRRCCMALAQTPALLCPLRPEPAWLCAPPWNARFRPSMAS